MTQTFNMVNGNPVADMSHLETPEACVSRKRAIEGRMGEIKRKGAAPGSSEWLEREGLKKEVLAIDVRLHELKEKQQLSKRQRNFAGLDSPLHELLKERMSPGELTELESAAILRLSERERKPRKKKDAATDAGS